MEEYRPAGFWIRVGATLLDSIIVGIPLVLLSYLLTGTTEETPVTTVGNMLYSILLPVVWGGYTIGKRIVGIRIRRIDGKKIGIGTMLLRTIVSGLAYLLSLGILIIVSAFMVGFREDKRSIHDFIAQTQVIRVK